MGQINITDKFGKSIIHTIIENNLSTNLEIGSWDGTGSTQCIIYGMNMINNPNKILQCIEVVPEKYNNLVANIKETYVKSYNMSSIGKNDLIPKTFDEIWYSPFNKLSKNYSRNVVEGWFKDDLKYLPDNGFINSKEALPTYDMVLIDGSEFFGYSEYYLLKNKTKCFILDDVFYAYKCNQIYNDLINNNEWKVISKNDSDRNGYAIFIKK